MLLCKELLSSRVARVLFVVVLFLVCEVR